jgi:hypothetical protein
MDPGSHVPLGRNLMFDHGVGLVTQKTKSLKVIAGMQGIIPCTLIILIYFFLMPPLSLFPLLTFEQVFSSMPAYSRRMKMNS